MRLKIIAGNVVVVLVISLVSYLVVNGQLRSGLVAGFEDGIVDDSTLFARSWELSGRQFLDVVAERAQSQPVRDSFGGLDNQSRRRRAHEACNSIMRWLADPARGRRGQPDLVVITDETGATVARNLDLNRTLPLRRLDSLRQVLADGQPRVDVWNNEAEGKLEQVVIARIETSAGAVLGALVVGYVISDALAEEEARVLGRQVAFLTADGITASSLDARVRDPLKEYLYETEGESTRASIGGTISQNVFETEIDGDRWVGMVAPLPKSGSYPMAYVVAGNKSARAELASAASLILAIGALGVLFCLIYGFIIGTSFLKPIEQIEEGVLAVINGRTDLRIDVESAELGGLAYRINQLINVFTGVEEEDSDGRVSGPPPSQWGELDEGGGRPAAAAAPAAGGGGPGDVVDDPALADRLAAEPEDAYYARLYASYVSAKTALGENVSNIPQERFIQRLQKNAEALASKHGCRTVRFQVETRDNQVTLRPVLIR